MPTFDPRDLADWTGGRWDPAPSAPLSGVSNDTRSLPRGSLYVALKGERFDGHSFVGAAFVAGAGAALVNASSAPATAADCPLLRVQETGAALRAMAQAYRRRVNPLIVAVTGSAGKSTVKEMIAQIVCRRASTARTRGNWNNAVGLPLSLLAMEPDVQVGVFEVGTNHCGEVDDLCRTLEPSWGVVTNVGPVHMEFFGSLDAIIEEKGYLLAALPTEGVAFLDRDAPYFARLAHRSRARVVTIARANDADYVCTEWTPAENAMTVREAGKTHRIPLPVPGCHNVRNALLAIAVARTRGIDWETIQDGLREFEAMPMRWQETDCAGVLMINDAYNANPMSMRAALDTFRERRAEGRKWLVLGGMLELGEMEREEHLALGRYVAGGPWVGLMAVGHLGSLIADGAADAGLKDDVIIRCANNAEAAVALAERTLRGDAVLLKASRGMHLEEVAAGFRKSQGGS